LKRRIALFAAAAAAVVAPLVTATSASAGSPGDQWHYMGGYATSAACQQAASQISNIYVCDLDHDVYVLYVWNHVN